MNEQETVIFSNVQFCPYCGEHFGMSLVGTPKNDDAHWSDLSNYTSLYMRCDCGHTEPYIEAVSNDTH